MSTTALNLGNELEIVKRLSRQEFEQPRRREGPKYIPKYRQVILDPRAVTAPRSFTYEFRRMPEELALADEGLGQLYLCFGAPGTGKSNLLKHLLLQLDAKGWEMPWGGLLLDPKLTLVGDVQEVIPPERLHVVGPSSGNHTNLLASNLGARDLGTALALAAQSSGIGGGVPYWTNELKRLLGAGLALLEIVKDPLTLNTLARLMLDQEIVGEKTVPALRITIEQARHMKLDSDESRRLSRAISELEQFTKSKGENADTVRSFLSQSLAPFLDPDLDYVSDASSTDSIADMIFRDGKWVMLDVPRSALSVSRLLSGLAKVLFQRAALERDVLYPQHRSRRVFLFIDEYAEVASDVSGEGFGDSIFFSQMRQFRILAFVATQGIPMLENSGVRETWKAILTNSAGKLFFRVADPDTANIAPQLLGEGEFLMADHGLAQSAGDSNVHLGTKLDRRTSLTSDLFLSGLKRGEIVFVGNTDGKGNTRVRYALVPKAGSRQEVSS